MRQKTCSACGGKMQSLGNMELQKGKFEFFAALTAFNIHVQRTG